MERDGQRDDRGAVYSGRKDHSVTILYLLLTWVVGIVAASFLLAPPIIILVFGIPFTYEMKRQGVLTGSSPAGRYLASLFLLLGLFVVVSWGIWHFFPAYVWGYVVGLVLTFVPSLRKCGRTQANIADFLATNSECLDKDALARWMHAKETARDHQ